MTGDIKNCYLMTPLKQWEIFQTQAQCHPTEIIDEYQLQDKVTQDGHLYIKIRRGMYGLPQAGLLAQRLLRDIVANHGYHQSQLVPGMWKHKTR